MKPTPIRRGDIYWVDFDPSKATEIQKTRPAIICSHDIVNENSMRVIVAPITSNLKKVYSFEYAIRHHPDISGKIMLDQMRSVDKSRLGKKVGSLPINQMSEVDAILTFILGLA